MRRQPNKWLHSLESHIYMTQKIGCDFPYFHDGCEHWHLCSLTWFEQIIASIMPRKKVPVEGDCFKKFWNMESSRHACHQFSLRDNSPTSIYFPLCLQIITHQWSVNGKLNKVTAKSIQKPHEADKNMGFSYIAVSRRCIFSLLP